MLIDRTPSITDLDGCHTFRMRQLGDAERADLYSNLYRPAGQRGARAGARAGLMTGCYSSFIGI